MKKGWIVEGNFFGLVWDLDFGELEVEKSGRFWCCWGCI